MTWQMFLPYFAAWLGEYEFWSFRLRKWSSLDTVSAIFQDISGYLKIRRDGSRYPLSDGTAA